MDYIWIGIAVVSLLIFIFMWWESRNPGKAVKETIEQIERGAKAMKEAHETVEKIIKEYQEATKDKKDK